MKRRMSKEMQTKVIPNVKILTSLTNWQKWKNKRQKDWLWPLPVRYKGRSSNKLSMRGQSGTFLEGNMRKTFKNWNVHSLCHPLPADCQFPFYEFSFQKMCLRIHENYV